MFVSPVETIDITKKFYTYLWLRDDGSPYYVGKGCRQRAFAIQTHRLTPPKDRSKILVFPMMSESEAIESEIALIDLFGREDLGKGCLFNLTDGGNGIISPESRRKISRALKGRTMTPEWREKLRAANLGKKQSPETIAKRSAAMKGKSWKWSSESIANRKGYKKGIPHSAEHKANQSAGLKKSWAERKSQ